MAAAETQSDDIRKFEEIGTHPAAGYLAIGEALTFHQLLGGKRKEARLRYLRDSWAKPLLTHDRIRLHTSLDPRFSCGIGTVEIEGVAPNELAGHLFHTQRIIVTGIGHDEVKGIRVSPSVYSTHEEIGRFVDAMLDVADHGLPS